MPRKGALPFKPKEDREASMGRDLQASIRVIGKRLHANEDVVFLDLVRDTQFGERRGELVDFMLIGEKVIAFDAKEEATMSFNFSRFDEKSTAKQRRVLQSVKKKGHLGGFIVRFGGDNSEVVSFFSIEYVDFRLLSGKRGSLKPEEGVPIDKGNCYEFLLSLSKGGNDASYKS